MKRALQENDRALVAAARQARLRAHAPYSGFRVGAALALRDGRLFTGCNVENASLGAALCAERAALVQAVGAGARPGDLHALAVYTTDPEPTPPCGMCLQCIVEFAQDLTVLLAGPRRLERTRLGALLPRPFRSFSQGPSRARAGKVGRQRRS